MMFNQSATFADSSAVALRPVRDGRSAPIVCAACGCRLQESDGGFAHFDGGPDRDARGCRVACVNESHVLA